MAATRDELLEVTFPVEPGPVSEDARALVLSLFDRHRTGMHRYVLSFGLDAGESEDVVQEAFLALWRHVRRDGDRSNLAGWLFRVAHHQALTRRGRTRRRERLAARAPRLVATGVETPEERLAALERRARLRAVVGALPARDRRCLELRAEGLRYREIAGVLGVSLGTVAATLTRVLARLRRADETGA